MAQGTNALKGDMRRAALGFKDQMRAELQYEQWGPQDEVLLELACQGFLRNMRAAGHELARTYDGTVSLVNDEMNVGQNLMTANLNAIKARREAAIPEVERVMKSIQETPATVIYERMAKDAQSAAVRAATAPLDAAHELEEKLEVRQRRKATPRVSQVSLPPERPLGFNEFGGTPPRPRERNSALPQGHTPAAIGIRILEP